MQTQYLIEPEVPQVPPYDGEQMAQGLAKQLAVFLFPLLLRLDQLLDKRLVRTFLYTVQVIITYRDRVGGLLLSELGGYLESPDKAPAGTKRLSNLLHSPKWRAQVVEDDLWQRADQQVERWHEQGEDALAIWDSSEWEKPESFEVAGLCAVRSSKAKRLTHIKPGYYNPPSRPIFVPGMHWLAVIVVGHAAQLGPPLLATMRWWSSRGANASFKRDERSASSWWNGSCRGGERWCISSIRGLPPPSGWASCWPLPCASCCAGVLTTNSWMRKAIARLAWRIALGKRGWSERTIWDSRRARWVRASVLALPVTHPDHRETPLWLVVCRSQGRTPWYLLTAEPISSDEDAWRIVFAYVRRWQIELTWRYDKSELAFQSPRLWRWEERVKLLALAMLAYAFLLHLLAPRYEPLRLWLLRYFCHRTGWHLRRITAPLYRLRSALSRLWQRYPPSFAALGRARRGEGLLISI